MTHDDIMSAREYHYGTCTSTTGPRGGTTVQQEVWRRIGATKTWRTRPDEYRIPVKHGLRSYSTITHYNADEFHTAAQCTLRK